MIEKDSIKESEKKRLFIAVELPEDVRSRLFKITSSLKREDLEIRPVPSKNIHLTLKFLGDVNIERIHKISRALEITSSSKKPFSYILDSRLDAFPNIHNARVVFVPVGSGSGQIEEFYESLEDNLSKIKIRKESRKFISHITVARVKVKKDIAHLLKRLRPATYGECDFKKITLFESILKPSGAEYIILDEYELK